MCVVASPEFECRAFTVVIAHAQGSEKATSLAATTTAVGVLAHLGTLCLLSTSCTSSF